MKAKACYEAAGVLGSDEKDQLRRRTYCVAGAEVDSSLATVADKATLVAFPAHKRIALAAASLRRPSVQLFLKSLSQCSDVQKVPDCHHGFLLFGKVRPQLQDGQ